MVYFGIELCTNEVIELYLSIIVRYFMYSYTIYVFINAFMENKCTDFLELCSYIFCKYSMLCFLNTGIYTNPSYCNKCTLFSL